MHKTGKHTVYHLGKNIAVGFKLWNLNIISSWKVYNNKTNNRQLSSSSSCEYWQGVQDFWLPSGRSGMSTMSKTWGYVLWGFYQCNPTYDTFLESLGHCEYFGRVYTTFGHHQEDQEGQESPKHGVLEDFCCFDGYFVIVPPHMIPFWNPWDIVSTLEGCTRHLVTIRKIRKVKNVQNMGFWRILAVLMGIL